MEMDIIRNTDLEINTNVDRVLLPVKLAFVSWFYENQSRHVFLNAFRSGTRLGRRDFIVSGLHFTEEPIAVSWFTMWMWWSHSNLLTTGMWNSSNRYSLEITRISLCSLFYLTGIKPVAHASGRIPIDDVATLVDRYWNRMFQYLRWRC